MKKTISIITIGGFLVLGLILFFVLTSRKKKSDYPVLDLKNKEDSIKFFSNVPLLGDEKGNILYKNKKYFPDSMLTIENELNGEVIYRLVEKDSSYLKEEVFKPEHHQGVYRMSFSNDSVNVNQVFRAEVFIASRFSNTYALEVNDIENYTKEEKELPDGGKEFIYTAIKGQPGTYNFSGKIKVWKKDDNFKFNYIVR